MSGHYFQPQFGFGRTWENLQPCISWEFRFMQPIRQHISSFALAPYILYKEKQQLVMQVQGTVSQRCIQSGYMRN